MPRELLPLHAADLSSFAKSLRRQLGEHHDAHQALPGHVEMLNMLARAAGHRNVQGLRAAATAAASAPDPTAVMSDAAPGLAVAATAAAPAGPAPSDTTATLTTGSTAAAERVQLTPGRRRALARGTLPRDQPPPARGPRDPSLSTGVDRALRQFDGAGRLTRWPSRFATQRLVLWGVWMHFDLRRHYNEREVNEVINTWHLFGDHCTLRRELVEMKLLARTPDGARYHRLRAEPDADVVSLLQRLRERAAVAA